MRECVRLFGDRWGSAEKGSITLSGTTDNLGNTFSVAKLMSSKFPAVVILAELAEQLRSRDMERDLAWAPRDQNEEADALTNLHFSEFDPALRVVVDPADIQWLIMNRMMDVAEDLYKQVKAQQAAPKVYVAVKGKKKKKKFRENNPW